MIAAELIESGVATRCARQFEFDHSSSTVPRNRELNRADPNALKEEAMNRKRKVRTPVTLFVAIESAQNDALRKIAFDQCQSPADLVREALGAFIAGQKAGTSAAPRPKPKPVRAK